MEAVTGPLKRTNTSLLTEISSDAEAAGRLPFSPSFCQPMFANPLDEYEMSIPLSAFPFGGSNTVDDENVSVEEDEGQDDHETTISGGNDEMISLSPSSSANNDNDPITQDYSDHSPPPTPSTARSMSPVSPPLPRRPNSKGSIPQSAPSLSQPPSLPDATDSVTPTPQASPTSTPPNPPAPFAPPNPKFSSLSGLTEAKLTLYVHCILPPVSAVSPPPFIIIHGPPGTGKTSLARCLAGEKSWQLMEVEVEKSRSKFVGEGEKYLTAKFQAWADTGGLLLVDELEMYGAERAGGVDQSVTGCLLVLLSRWCEGLTMKPVEGCIIGVTNCLEWIDQGIRRRASLELWVGGLEGSGRKGIIEAELGEGDWSAIVDLTEGWGGSDVKMLCKRSRQEKIARLCHAQGVGKDEDWSVRPGLSQNVTVTVEDVMVTREYMTLITGGSPLLDSPRNFQQTSPKKRARFSV
ncbi:hypothetical protein TrLO_g10997 [Triparma laevis f. longispina]|uniref:AAA+ ATPase domain-containing protein n=1 Tax=Triparma laevis f. longispina TaxID=1714387 RepID=A0A9W7C6C1_9STRA|nr:hypothetical protein TrLO_g10997 [Triparma laevis f. longispina]